MLVNFAGVILFALPGIKLLSSIIRIIVIYLLSPTIDLKAKAKGNWAVITGATDGIGKAYAFELAHHGFDIALISRTQSKLDDVKKELLETYPAVLLKIEGGLCRIQDILVVNTLPVTMLSAGLLPQMVKRKAGIVINVSSAASIAPVPFWALYSSTKKYISWFSETLRREYASEGIIIQAIAPWLVCSKMSKLKRTSFFIPDAKSFVRSAVSTIGISNDTAGYISHQIQTEMLDLLPNFLGKYLLDRKSRSIQAAALRKIFKESKRE